MKSQLEERNCLKGTTHTRGANHMRGKTSYKWNGKAWTKPLPTQNDDVTDKTIKLSYFICTDLSMY